MMGLSDGRKRFPIGLAVLILYRSVTDTQPPSHVAVAITLNSQASSLKNELDTDGDLDFSTRRCVFWDQDQHGRKQAPRLPEAT